MSPVRRVIVESPFGNANWLDPEDRNIRYLRACFRDCVQRGESPYASHGILTQPGVLRDGDPAERAQGIELGFAWREAADVSAFYLDLGWSTGMRAGREHAIRTPSHRIEYRSLGGEWAKLGLQTSEPPAQEGLTP